jgi:Bcr/CflA subfamily drug resistance transporter
MWPHKTFKSLVILLPLVFAFAVAQDIYIPAIPQLISVFHSTPGDLQYTLSFFMIFFGAGQLVIGPYSDQFGRRKVAFFSIVLYIISSLLCALSHSVTELVIYRSLEAIGSCGMLVIANAIVRDVFHEKNQSARMYSYLNASIAISPLLAPVLGGYIDVYFGWRACFIVLGILGVIAMLIILFQIPETHSRDRRMKLDMAIFKRYLSILKHPEFQFYAFAGAAAVSCLFTFFSMSPYLLIDALGVPRQDFGYYFGVMGLLFFFGSVTAGKIVSKVGVKKNILIGALLVLGGGVWMLLWAYAGQGLSRASFIIPMVPISLGSAFLIGAGAAGAMAPFGEMAGTAAALFGAGEFLISSLVGSIAMQAKMNSTMPLALVALIVGVVMTIWWFRFKPLSSRT